MAYKLETLIVNENASQSLRPATIACINERTGSRLNINTVLTEEENEAISALVSRVIKSEFG